jgi:hypothetical protein
MGNTDGQVPVPVHFTLYYHERDIITHAPTLCVVRMVHLCVRPLTDALTACLIPSRISFCWPPNQLFHIRSIMPTLRSRSRKAPAPTKSSAGRGKTGDTDGQNKNSVVVTSRAANTERKPQKKAHYRDEEKELHSRRPDNSSDNASSISSKRIHLTDTKRDGHQNHHAKRALDFRTAASNKKNKWDDEEKQCFESLPDDVLLREIEKSSARLSSNSEMASPTKMRSPVKVSAAVNPYAKPPSHHFVTPTKSPSHSVRSPFVAAHSSLAKRSNELNDEFESCYETLPDDVLLRAIESSSSLRDNPSTHTVTPMKSPTTTVRNPYAKRGINPQRSSSFGGESMDSMVITQSQSPVKSKREWEKEMESCYENLPGDVLLGAMDSTSSHRSLPKMNVASSPSKRHVLTPMKSLTLVNPYVKPDSLHKMITQSQSPAKSKKESQDETEDCFKSIPDEVLLQELETTPSSSGDVASPSKRQVDVPIKQMINPYAKKGMVNTSRFQSAAVPSSLPIKTEPEWKDDINRTYDSIPDDVLLRELDSRLPPNVDVGLRPMSQNKSNLNTYHHLAITDMNPSHSSTQFSTDQALPLDADHDFMPLHNCVTQTQEDMMQAYHHDSSAHRNSSRSVRVKQIHDGVSRASNPSSSIVEGLVCNNMFRSPVPPSNSPDMMYAKHTVGTVIHELAIPSLLVFNALFPEEVQWQLLDLDINPVQSSAFDLSGSHWTDDKLERLCHLWQTDRHKLAQKSQELKSIIFDSKCNVLQFIPIPLTEAFALEFPPEVLADRFFFNASNEVHSKLLEQVQTLKSDIYGKPSVISGTGMQQLQPSTEMSDTLFDQGRSEGEVELFDAMVRAAICHATKDVRVTHTSVKKKITYLLTARHLEQAPHRDFSKQLLRDRRRLPIVPWGLDMPLTGGGLLINMWPKQELDQIKSVKATGKGKDDSFEHRLPYTLDVSFRQILLFAGGTVHGGGFQRPLTNATTATIHKNNMDWCFRMHMYLSFAPARRTHAALEGQDQVELEDDEQVKYSTYLLKSNGSAF